VFTGKDYRLSFREKAAASLNEDAEQLVSTIREIVDGRGSVVRRIECNRCGHRDEYAIQVADVRAQLDAAKFLASEGLGRQTVPVDLDEMVYQDPFDLAPKQRGRLLKLAELALLKATGEPDVVSALIIIAAASDTMPGATCDRPADLADVYKDLPAWATDDLAKKLAGYEIDRHLVMGTVRRD
jgi:hypothetical protein